MKKIIFIFFLSLSIVGCSQDDVVNFDEKSIIVIEERVGDELSSDYQVIKEIDDVEVVQKVIDIFNDVRWKTNVEVDMAHAPDYKLNKNYHIWVTPKGNMLEIINTDNSYYVRLPEGTSSELFEILTGTDL